MLTLDEVLGKEMKNPEFKAEWDTLEAEFQKYVTILEAQDERRNGYQGRNGREVLADMRKIISVTSEEQ